MRALVKYIDFHMDNHQGGSGKTIESRVLFEIPEDLICKNFIKYVEESLIKYLEIRRPFGKSEHGYKPTIVSIEVYA